MSSKSPSLLSSDINIEFRKAAAEGNLEWIKTQFNPQGEPIHPALDLNQAGPTSGKTALHQAVLHDQEAVVEFLANLPSLKCLKDLAGKTPVQYTLEREQRILFRFLIFKFQDEPIRFNFEANDLMHIALYRKKLNTMIDVLKMRNVSVTQIVDMTGFLPPNKLYLGYSLLHLVVIHTNNLEAIVELIKRGYDPNQQISKCKMSCFYDTPLHIYIANESTEEAIQYIDGVRSAGKEIDFTKQDDEDKTPLFLAVKMRNPNLVRSLLERGAGHTLLIPDHKGRNVLHMVMALGDVETFNILRSQPEFSLLLTQTDKQGQTPQDMLNMNEYDTRSLIRSVDIQPDRDLNAPRNDTHSSFIKANRSFLTACLEGRESIKTSLPLTKPYQWTAIEFSGPGSCGL